MTKKQHLINLNNEFDSNLLIKDIKKYNNVKSYIDEDADNPKVKYYLFVVNEDNKIVRDNKGRAMKQSKFQELVINEFKEQKKFNEFVINEFKEQKKFKEFVINEFKEQKKFNEQQIKFNEFVTQQFAEQRKFNEQQLKFNELFSKRLDSIENRLTILESFHKEELKNYKKIS